MSGKHPSRRRRLLFSILFALMLAPFAPGPSFASGSPEKKEAALLVQLQLEQSKKQLRLDDERTPPGLMELYDENRLQEVIDRAAALPEEKKSAAVDLLQGNALLLLGERERAVAAYQQAYRRSELPETRAAAMANFGVAFSTKEAWKEAVEWIERALQIDRQRLDWRSQGIDLSLLGAFYYQLGDTAKGAAAHIEALEIAETVPIRWLEAQQLSSLGTLYYLDQALNPALEYHLKALGLYRQLGNPLGEAASQTALGLIYKGRKEFDLALAHQSEALAIYKRLNDRPAQATTQINLSLVYQDQGDVQAALQSAERALKIQEALGDLNGMAQTEGTLGTIYQTKGDLPAAIHHLEKARELFQKAGASQQIHIVDLRIQTLQDQIEAE